MIQKAAVYSGLALNPQPADYKNSHQDEPVVTSRSKPKTLASRTERFQRLLSSWLVIGYPTRTPTP